MRDCAYANFVGDGLKLNSIFDLGSKSNRDGCLEPYVLLRRLFLTQGVEMNTPDINRNNKVLFELHMDVQPCDRNNIPSYVMLHESPQIRPSNKQKLLLDKYRRVFTWRDDLVDGQHYIKLNLPNNIVVNSSRGWGGRNRLLCMIASNRTVRHSSPLLLYPERVRTIRWFEQYAPQDFDLFGVGWDAPASRSGFIGKVISKIQQKILPKTGIVFFPLYRGKVASKQATMQQYRFSICYENVRDLPGYITEKIFDSFFAGCVPVYWGASNIDDYVPEDCFIDRRKFANHEALYQFLISMREQDYIGYQERIAAFLMSDRAKPFSTEVYAETLVKTIMNDLAATT